MNVWHHEGTAYICYCLFQLAAYACHSLINDGVSTKIQTMLHIQYEVVFMTRLVGQL